MEGPISTVIIGGAGSGAGASVEAGVEVEASEGPRARALWVPKKVIIGSSGF